MTSPVAAATPDGGDDRPAPPFEPAVVEALLTQLDKTVRAVQQYPENNPIYVKAIESMRGAFAPVWAETDSLVLQVTDVSFVFFGVPVHVQHEKANDSLPWTLYKDGLREMTLTPGFEGEELVKFLAIIPRVRKALPLDDDLLTILWEQEFQHLAYRYVELAAEGVPIDPGATPGMWPVTAGEVTEHPAEAIDEAREEVEAAGAAGQGGAATAARPAGVVSMDDFDSALYFLEEHEVRYLKTELAAEYASDLRRVTLDSLLDIFEMQVAPLVRGEVVTHLDALTLHLLAGAQFANVAYLIREANAALERAREVTPEMRERVAGLADRLSEPGALSQLLQAMDDAETLPPKADLEQLFMQLRPASLGTIFGWLGQSQNMRLRPLLEGAADRLAASNTAEVVRLISSTDPATALEAVRRAGALKTAAAVGALGKALTEPDRDLRVAAVAALVAIGSAGAMQALEKAIDDSERDVRLAAIKALTQKVHRPALGRVTTVVKSKEVRDADRTERVALFELYGALCGDGGVPYLDELLNPKSGLFARKEDPEIRACAAVALGRIGTPKAQEVLQKAAGEKDVVVRNAVARALRGGSA